MDSLRKEYATVSYTEIRALLAILATPFSPLKHINSQIEALRKGLEPCGLFVAETEPADQHYTIGIPLFKD